MNMPEAMAQARGKITEACRKLNCAKEACRQLSAIEFPDEEYGAHAMPRSSGVMMVHLVAEELCRGYSKDLLLLLMEIGCRLGADLTAQVLRDFTEKPGGEEMLSSIREILSKQPIGSSSRLLLSLITEDEKVA